MDFSYRQLSGGSFTGTVELERAAYPLSRPDSKATMHSKYLVHTRIRTPVPGHYPRIV